MKYVPDCDAALYFDGEKFGDVCCDVFNLEETVPLMQSKDYRDRFVAEWAQTKIRLGKLNRILRRYYGGTPDFEPLCPIPLLEKQALAMTQYLDLLEIRAELERVKLPKEKLMEGET